MVVNYFHFVGISIAPIKTDAILFVDPDAELSFAIATQLFQPVAGWNHQILQGQRGVQHIELLQCLAMEPGWEPLAPSRHPKHFGFSISEPGNHVL